MPLDPKHKKGLLILGGVGIVGVYFNQRPIPIPCVGCDERGLFYKCIRGTGLNSITCDSMSSGAAKKGGKAIGKALDVSSYASELLAFASNLPQHLRKMLRIVLDLLKRLYKEVVARTKYVLKNLKKFWIMAWNKIKDMIGYSWQIIKKQVVDPFFEGLMKFIVEPMKMIISKMGKILAIVKNGITMAFRKMGNALETSWLSAVGGFDVLSEGVESAFKGIARAIGDMGIGLEQALTSTGEGLAHGFHQMGEGIGTAIEETVNGLGMGFTMTIDGILDAIEAMLDGIGRGMSGSVNGLVDAVNYTTVVPINKLSDQIQAAVGGLTEGVNGINKGYNAIRQLDLNFNLAGAKVNVGKPFMFIPGAPTNLKQPTVKKISKIAHIPALSFKGQLPSVVYDIPHPNSDARRKADRKRYQNIEQDILNRFYENLANEKRENGEKVNMKEIRKEVDARVAKRARERHKNAIVFKGLNIKMEKPKVKPVNLGAKEAKQKMIDDMPDFPNPLRQFGKVFSEVGRLFREHILKPIGFGIVTYLSYIDLLWASFFHLFTRIINYDNIRKALKDIKKYTIIGIKELGVMLWEEVILPGWRLLKYTAGIVWKYAKIAFKKVKDTFIMLMREVWGVMKLIGKQIFKGIKIAGKYTLGVTQYGLAQFFDTVPPFKWIPGTLTGKTFTLLGIILAILIGANIEFTKTTLAKIAGVALSPIMVLDGKIEEKVFEKFNLRPPLPNPT
jgi:hypothetical protein